MATRAAIPGIAIDSAGSIGEAQQAIDERKTGYRLVLLDFVLPDAHGFSGFLQLQLRLGRTPIVMVSAYADPIIIEAARALGASGFLSKSLALDDLAAALRRIARGDAFFPDQQAVAAAAQTARDRISTLSPAQLRVMLALADGRLNKQIASDLNLTEATVKAHLTTIFRKLGVANRAQALLAMQPLLGDVAQS